MYEIYRVLGACSRNTYGMYGRIVVRVYTSENGSSSSQSQKTVRDTTRTRPPPPRYFTVVPRRRSGRDTGGTFPPTSGLAFKRLFDGFPALQTIDTSPERRGERTGFKIKSYTFGRDPGFVEVPVFRILLDDSKNDGARGKRGDPPHRKLLLFPRQFTPKRTNSPTCYRH